MGWVLAGYCKYWARRRPSKCGRPWGEGSLSWRARPPGPGFLRAAHLVVPVAAHCNVQTAVASRRDNTSKILIGAVYRQNSSVELIMGRLRTDARGSPHGDLRNTKSTVTTSESNPPRPHFCRGCGEQSPESPQAARAMRARAHAVCTPYCVARKWGPHDVAARRWHFLVPPPRFSGGGFVEKLKYKKRTARSRPLQFGRR
jgi:hypothetical protein